MSASDRDRIEALRGTIAAWLAIMNEDELRELDVKQTEILVRADGPMDRMILVDHEIHGHADGFEGCAACETATGALAR